MTQEKIEGIYPDKIKTELLYYCYLIPRGEHHGRRRSRQADCETESTPEQPVCRSSEGKQPNLRINLIFSFLQALNEMLVGKWGGGGGSVGAQT